MKSDLVDACSRLFDVHPRDLMSHYRFRFLTLPRFALYKALHLRGWSYGAIARFMDRDHTTIIHGVARASYYMSKDAAYAAKVQELVAYAALKISDEAA